MKACRSCTVELRAPTSPISPPTETVTPAGSRWRMKLGELHREMRVELLLFGQGRQREVDDGGGVDVDVVIAGGDGLRREVAQGRQLLLRVGGVILGADLVVVALDEDRPFVPFLDRRRQGVAGVLGGPLLGVGHFGAGQLEKHDLAAVGAGGAEDGAHGVVGEAAHVDRRRRAVLVLAAAGGHVEGMDRSRPGAERRRGGADDPARGVPFRAFAEDGGGDQAVDRPLPEARGVDDLDAAIVNADDAGHRLQQFVDRCEGERRLGGSHLAASYPVPKGGSQELDMPAAVRCCSAAIAALRAAVRNGTTKIGRSSTTWSSTNRSRKRSITSPRSSTSTVAAK